jgi:hypothetical protein
MSVEDDNKVLVRRYIDLFNRNDLPTEEVIAPLASSFVYHRPGMPDVTGLTCMRQVVEMYRSAITDMHGESKTSLRSTGANWPASAGPARRNKHVNPDLRKPFQTRWLSIVAVKLPDTD